MGIIPPRPAATIMEEDSENNFEYVSLPIKYASDLKAGDIFSGWKGNQTIKNKPKVFEVLETAENTLQLRTMEGSEKCAFIKVRDLTAAYEEGMVMSSDLRGPEDDLSREIEFLEV
jgi:hypothetical protein